MDKSYCIHLLKHHGCTNAPALAYSFHDLISEAFLVEIAAILPELLSLILQYFDIMDYVSSLYGQ